MFIFKRGSVYYAEYFDPVIRKTKRISTGQTNKLAAEKFAEALNQNFTPITSSMQPIGIKKYAKEYLSYAEVRYSHDYVRSIKLSFDQLEKYFGDTDLGLITKKLAEQFIGETFLRAKHSAMLYNRTLKAAFNKAIDWGYIYCNPFKGVSIPKINKKLPVYINKIELEKIIVATEEEQLKSLFRIAFNTGLRLGELVNLRWSAIDNKNKLIILGNDDFVTKSKTARVIPINKVVKYELEKLFKEYLTENDYVFQKKKGIRYNHDYISKKFKAAVRVSGVSEKLHFHSLRHGFASRLVQNGANIYVVKELLGHKDVATTQIYSHLNRDSLRETINLLK